MFGVVLCLNVIKDVKICNFVDVYWHAHSSILSGKFRTNNFANFEECFLGNSKVFSPEVIW